MTRLVRNVIIILLVLSASEASAFMPMVLGQKTSGCSLGSDVVVNGSFTGSTANWDFSGIWVLWNNQMDKQLDGIDTLSQVITVSAGQIWRITYTRCIGAAGDTGDVFVSIGGTSGTTRTTAGTYTEDITAIGAGNLTFTPSNTARFCIDDVSARLRTCE